MHTSLRGTSPRFSPTRTYLPMRHSCFDHLAELIACGQVELLRYASDRLASDAPEPAAECGVESEGGGEGRGFGVVLNLPSSMGPPPDRVVEIEGAEAEDLSLLAVAEARAVQMLRILDRWPGLGARLALDPPATLWRCPVQTVSQSEDGYERVAQQVALLQHWPLGGSRSANHLRRRLIVESWNEAGE